MKRHIPSLQRRQFLGGMAAAASAVVPASPVLAQFVDQPTRLTELSKTPSWQQLRAQFDLRPGITYLNNGTLGPIPRPVRDARSLIERSLAEDPAGQLGAAHIDRVRQRVAAFVNSDPDEIALTRSTTEGLNIFALGVDLKPGDEVIIGDEEHSGATSPYKALEKRLGIRIVSVKLPLPLTPDTDRIIAAYRQAITSRSRIIVVSQATYRSGAVLPVRELAALARSHGLLISVDGAQSFGVLPLDLQTLNIDHYAAPGHKWLLAGTGTGFTWIRKELQARVQPLVGFYDSMSINSADHTARRYEKNGQANLPAVLGLVDAIEFHTSIGAERIAARNRQLALQLREGLQGIDAVRIWTPSAPALSAGLTTITLNNLDAEAVVSALRKRQIIVRSVPVAGQVGVRISTHFYNSSTEIDTLLASFREFVAKPALLS